MHRCRTFLGCRWPSRWWRSRPDRSRFREDTTSIQIRGESGKRSFSIVSVQPIAEPAPPITSVFAVPAAAPVSGHAPPVSGACGNRTNLSRMRYHLEAKSREQRSPPACRPAFLLSTTLR
jgi:hypothetical protein